ncbi:MAG TPA: hypothetical protein VNA21_08640 [Steroidobacteraceae bacterium]|nr:hypothetical protein [Steroidobacteraceae bacterium]
MFEALFTHPLWAYRTGTFAFASQWPLWLLAVLILVGVVVIAATLWRRHRGTGQKLSLPKLFLLGTLQSLFVAAILCLLWRPVLNVERVRDRENVLAVMLDASASMAYGEQDQSRMQQAVGALRGEPLEALQKVFDVQLYSFAHEPQPLPTIDAVPPPGAQTRIGDSLIQVLQTAASAPLAGVVLLSDGAENGNTLSEERLTEIASYGVPVHTVGLGPETNPQDLELERVDLTSSAPAGATVSAQVGIRHDGAGTTRLRVYDRDKLVVARDLKLPADAPITNVSIEVPAAEPGTRELRFVLDPLEGERNVVNNERTHVMDVAAGKRSILYVEGEPRWEYKFLRRATDGDRSLRVVSLVRTTPNKHFRQGVNSPAELIDGFPSTAAELFAYDAVIIGSYEATTLNQDQHRLLKEFVDKRGGSLLMLAGRKGLSAGGWYNTQVAQTLPTHLPTKQGSLFVQRTGQAQPTLYGGEYAITRLDVEPRRNAEAWKTLPPLADFQELGRPKPGAIVLLEAVAERNREPLLVWQRYGRGSTYLLGTSSTMRWQMQLPPEDQRHEMFWRQFMHALADNTPRRSTLTSERTVYNDERSVTLEAEIANEEFAPVSDAEVEVLIAPEREAPFTQVMRPSGNGDGRYVATIDAPTAGLYRIDMNARRNGQTIAGATTHVRRTDGVVEHFATRQNRPVLERIAAMTGGRYWSIDDLKGLAAAIPFSKAGIVERQTLDLWNLPIVFLALLLLKLGEWLLRLLWGRL